MTTTPFSTGKPPSRLLRRLRAWDLRGLVLIVISGLLMLLLSTAWPQERGDDPPARVGRLADMQGSVWMLDPQAGEWQAAQRNRPVTGGDRLSTERGARAEVRIGPSVVRVGEESELEVLQLDDQRVRLQLHAGSLALHLTSQDAAREFEIVTAHGRLLPQRDGHYRVDRSGDSTFATAWTGKMSFEAADSTLDVAPGQRFEFWRDGPTHYTMHPIEYDPFTNWARARGTDDDRSPPRYVSPQMTGWEDLDRNGRWETTAEYGTLWVPAAVAPDWAPYRYGHWAWIRPWGWTWVDDAPWGFAPFHYGRWVRHRNVWCWAPGTYVARPVYAPALVAWVGGPRASVSVSIGSQPVAPVGWFPLAPREVYVPSYHVSPRYVQNINVTHVTNVTVINQTIQRPPARYVNRQVVNAVTVVPADVLHRRLPVAPAVIRGRDAQLVAQDATVRRDVPVTAPARWAAPAGGAVVPPAPWRRSDASRAEGREKHQTVPSAPLPNGATVPAPALSGGPSGQPHQAGVPNAQIVPPPHRADERQDRGRHDERSRAPTSAPAPVPASPAQPAPRWSATPAPAVPAPHPAPKLPANGADAHRTPDPPRSQAPTAQPREQPAPGPGWRVDSPDERGRERGRDPSRSGHPQDGNGNRREQRQ